MADVTKSTKKTRNKDDDSITIDRLTGLAIHILHHILSFLPTKHVSQTCFLSKRWKQIWRSIPSLNFSQCQNQFSGEHHLESFVNSVLLFRNHNHSDIQSLRIYCPHKLLHPLHLNSWIMHARNLNVQVLDLDFSGLESFNLTPWVFAFSSLTVLKLSLCFSIVTFPTSIYLPLLKVLLLRDIKFQDQKGTEALFSCCPQLETLTLDGCCYNFNCLTISNPRLRNLTIDRFLPSKTAISTPNLVSFKLLRYNLYGSDLCFTNDLISLVESEISLTITPCKPSLFQLIRVVQNVQSLTLCEQVLSTVTFLLQEDMHMIEHIQIPFPNLKWLKIGTCFSAMEILVINTLLKYSSNIETLILEYYEWGFDIATKEKIWLDYLLPHLKSVRMQNFEGCKYEVEFVKFLLKNAMILEKLTIAASVSTMWSASTSKRGSVEHQITMMRIREELLAYPHASPNVEVLFM